MVRRSGWRVATILVGLGLVVGCGSNPVVGVLLPTTGAASTYGESIESGIRLALSDAREHQELPEGFEVVWADTGSNTVKAVSELRTMVSDRGVKLVIAGATSSEARALLPVLEDLDVVCISPSASAPGLSEKSRNFYRLYPSDELEGSTAGKFLRDRLGVTKVVVYTGDTEYTRGIEPEFRNQYVDNLGGDIVATVDLTGDDWREESERALRSDPQAVYIVGYAEEILEVLQHLKEEGFTGRVVTTSAFYSSRIIHEAGDLAEGLMFPLPPFDRTSEKEPVLSFVARYMDTYQRAPDVFAAHGYDAMRLVIETLKLAKPLETSEIHKALHFGVSDFMGVTGPILFDDYGDVKHYPKMFIVKDGQVLGYQQYMKAERARILGQVQDLLQSGR
jgi:branched-chain amino acid transport system substrate-binding protein